MKPARKAATPDTGVDSRQDADVFARRAEPFATTLRRRQKNSGIRRKGERTRDRLKIAALQVLEERGYLKLRVSDVCKRARVSAAAFYQYFRNKQDVTVEVLTEFLHYNFRIGNGPAVERSFFDSLREANLMWIGSVRANAGLMRCLLQLGDQVPEFKKLNQRLNYEWFAYVTERLLKRYPRLRTDERTVLLAVYALGGMMDELSRKVLVAREENLEAVIEATAPSDEALAEFLSVLWYRALFAADPPDVSFAASRSLLRLSSVDPAAVQRR